MPVLAHASAGRLMFPHEISTSPKLYLVQTGISDVISSCAEVDARDHKTLPEGQRRG